MTRKCFSRKGAKAQRKPRETRQRFASLRLCARKSSSYKAQLRATIMSNFKLFLLAIATCLSLFPAIVFSQTKPAPSGEAQDVVKFDTSLVQTDVMVFDKKGRFVDGLKPEQFQLRINNTQREISFFDRISSRGSAGQPDEVQPGQPNSASPFKAEAQRRAVIFFVDDLH